MLKAQLEATARVRIRQDTMVVGSAMGVASDEKGKEVKFKDWLSALANTGTNRQCPNFSLKMREVVY